MAYYERRLPHWDEIGKPLFVTFRLHGSLPPNRVFPPANQTAGEAFAAMDRLLDEARSGPVYLRQPAIAQLVVQALHDGQERFHRYDLHAYVVMPNHVHLLVSPAASTREWLMPLKGFTGHEASRMLCLNGPFSQDESYDHDRGEFERGQGGHCGFAGGVSMVERGGAGQKPGGGLERPPHQRKQLKTKGQSAC